MNNMKTITINKNKNYYRKIALLLLIVFIFYVLIKFLRYPSAHIYFLLPTRNSVIIFSIIGILLCCLTGFLILKNIFRKDAFLRINEKGIYNGFFLYNKKLIKWEEINKIETIKHNYNNYIAIFLKETPNTESGISSVFSKINEKSMGTPYIINPRDFDCSLQELEQLILQSYNEVK